MRIIGHHKIERKGKANYFIVTLNVFGSSIPSEIYDLKVSFPARIFLEFSVIFRICQHSNFLGFLKVVINKIEKIIMYFSKN